MNTRFAIVSSLLLAVATGASASDLPPSKLVKKPAQSAMIKFSITLPKSDDAQRCQAWLQPRFAGGSISVEKATGASARHVVTVERRFEPPYSGADAIHAALPQSPCGMGTVSVSTTQSLTADEAVKALKPKG